MVTVGKLKLNVLPVNVARMIAATAGYSVDLEPMEPGRVKVTATKDGAGPLHGTGKNVDDACLDIINKIVKEL